METAAGPADSGQDGGRDVASLGEITLESVRRVFPLWHIFPAEGAFWAVRGGWQAWSGPDALLLRAMTAADLTVLAERLCLQEWLDGLTSDGLTAVWKGVLARGRQAIDRPTSAWRTVGGVEAGPGRLRPASHDACAVAHRSVGVAVSRH